MDGPGLSAQSGRYSHAVVDSCRVSHAWKAKEEPGTWSDKRIAVVPDDDTVPDVQACDMAARARRVLTSRVRARLTAAPGRARHRSSQQSPRRSHIRRRRVGDARISSAPLVSCDHGKGVTNMSDSERTTSVRRWERRPTAVLRTPGGVPAASRPSAVLRIQASRI